MSRKTVRRINKFKVFRFVFCVGIVIFLAFFCFVFFDKSNDNFSSNKDDVNEIDSSDVRKISLVMVGDNLIHDKIYNYAYSDGKYDFSSILEYISPIVNKFDLAYYNQETILGGKEIGLSSYPAFNSPYEVGDAMIDAGFNLVSLATNHTLDRGYNAVVNSRDYWNSKSDVLAVGSYSSFEERDKIQVREVNGIKYTMLNYTYGTNGINVPSGKEYLVNVWPVTGNNPLSDTKYQDYKKVVKEDIERVRDKVDLLMVAMHWGVEYENMPNGYQEDMANYLASLGVDVIIGTHPHVIQPVTYIGNTLVIYSLGNFLSAHEVINMDNRVGLMSMVDISLENGKIELFNLKNELLYTYYTSDYNGFKVVPFSSDVIGNYLSDYGSIYNKYKDVVTKLNKNIVVNSLKG